MQWRDIAFAHWRVSVEQLAHTLPAGLTLDTHEGAAWLSVVPFRMTDVHPRRVPVLPGFGDVREINLRTYVRVGERRGVFFYSLDAGSPLAVRAARLSTGLPYFDATIETSERAGTIDYASTRTHRGQPPATFRASYRPQGDRLAIGSLETFLHERYSFFVARGERIVRGDIAHAPWKLESLDLTIETNTLAAGLGISLMTPPDRTYFSRGMPVSASA